MERTDLRSEASELLAGLHVGRIRSVAYDTAWAARPSKIGASPTGTEFPGALRWLLTNQMWDGSWGSEVPYYHDRVLSTAAAVNALRLNDAVRYRDRIDRGIEYLWRNMANLEEDPVETIGAELLLPRALEEGQELGLDMPAAPASVLAKRERKLGLIPKEMMLTCGTSLAFSLEFLGDDARPKDLERCIYPNGSLGCSPSATMYLLERTGSERARRFLQWASSWMRSGGFPSQLPFDVFEHAWAIYNLMKGGIKGVPGMGRALQRLHLLWLCGSKGAAWGSEFPLADADTSAIAFKVLWDGGYRPGPEVFETYELDEGYKCMEFELNPSMSTQVHVLEALQDLPRAVLPRKDEIIEKVLGYLERTATGGERWSDKWHASSYYTTGNCVLALARIAPHLTERPIDWMLRNQLEDGGWGAFGTSTVEETAYAVQALNEYSTHVEALDSEPLLRGARFIQSRRHKGFEKLWIAKGLYCPLNVVSSAALSVLYMCHTDHGYDLNERPIEAAPTAVPVDADGAGGA